MPIVTIFLYSCHLGDLSIQSGFKQVLCISVENVTLWLRYFCPFEGLIWVFLEHCFDKNLLGFPNFLNFLATLILKNAIYFLAEYLKGQLH